LAFIFKYYFHIPNTVEAGKRLTHNDLFTSSKLTHFDSLCQMFICQMMMIRVLDVLIFLII